MALGMVSGRFQFQRATKAEWEQSEIVLLDGEIAIESDTTKMKAGDGKTVYRDLPYISIGDFSFSDLSEEDKKRVQGKKGDPFTYDDFTQKQLDALKGKKGEPFRFEDFTKEQLASLVGPKGDAFKFEDFTDEQLEKLGVYITDISKKGDDNIITFKGGKQLVVKDGKDAVIDVESVKKLDDGKKNEIRDVLNVPAKKNVLKDDSIRQRIKDIAASNAIFAQDYNVCRELNNVFAEGTLPQSSRDVKDAFFEDEIVMAKATSHPKVMRAILDSPVALFWMGLSPVAMKAIKDNFEDTELNVKEWNDKHEYKIEFPGGLKDIDVKAGETKTIYNLSLYCIDTIVNSNANEKKIHCKLGGHLNKVSEVFNYDNGKSDDMYFWGASRLIITNNYEDSCDITLILTEYY